jgi:hypothetical protein
MLAVEPRAIGRGCERSDARGAEVGRGMAGHDIECARQLENGQGVRVHV